MTHLAREAHNREIDGARAREIAGEVAQLARSLLGENTQVIWFGSWPRGKAVAHSDIDVAVSIGIPIPAERMALLHDAVDDIATLYEIDLIDLGSAGPGLRDEVLKHGERL
jgi:predicted nucleotidyltransferase